MQAIFTHANDTHRATYLLLRHPESTLLHAVRYPLATLTLVHALERIASTPLHCPELPKRLFKGLTKLSSAASRDLDPLLPHLLERYSASPNTAKGYPLARAVFARHVPLIKLLLHYGADPTCSKEWSLLAAIGEGDLTMLRLLVERDRGYASDEDIEEEEGNTLLVNGQRKKKRRRSSLGDRNLLSSIASQVKRRKFDADDRCRVTQTMLEAAVKAQAWDIVAYLRLKGAVPTLKVLQLLERDAAIHRWRVQFMGFK